MSHHIHTSPFNLHDKVAFVTGGNGGIGLGIAEGFLQHGASVAIAARNADKLESAVASLTATADGDSSRVLALSCDVTDRASVQAALDETMSKLGGWDIIVNNAGTNRRSDEPQNLSDDDWRYVIDTNLTSMHNVSSLTFDHMRDKGAGKYINIGSMMSIFGTAYASAYAASKGGVVQYTKSCAVAWAHTQRPSQRHSTRLDRHGDDQSVPGTLPRTLQNGPRTHPRRPLGHPRRSRRNRRIPSFKRIRLRNRHRHRSGWWLFGLVGGRIRSINDAETPTASQHFKVCPATLKEVS